MGEYLRKEPIERGSLLFAAVSVQVYVSGSQPHPCFTISKQLYPHHASFHRPGVVLAPSARPLGMAGSEDRNGGALGGPCQADDSWVMPAERALQCVNE